LGPEVEVAIALEFEAKAKLDLKSEFSSTAIAGHTHVDFKDSSKTKTEHWNPTHSASANLFESGTLSIILKVLAKMGLACSLIGKLLDSSTRVKVSAGFPLEFGATSIQDGTTPAVEGTGNSTKIDLADTEERPNRFGYKADFAVVVEAYATSWLTKEWDVYSPPSDRGACHGFRCRRRWAWCALLLVFTQVVSL